MTQYTAHFVFLLFVAVTLWITWWAARRTRSMSDFYAAGNRIGGFQNGLAIAGDFMSAAAFLGTTGMVLFAGLDTMIFIIGLTLGWTVILFLIAERLRNLGAYTFADVCTQRLARLPVRTLSACGTLAVAIPYLIAQMVGAGALVEALFGLPYAYAVIVVGVLMTVYVSVGGMVATTWVQIVKAALLLFGGTLLTLLLLAQFDFNIGVLARAAVEAHPKGLELLKPGLIYGDLISSLSIALAFVCGVGGLPHVLMRFFTVPDGRQARRSAGYAVIIIGCFTSLMFLIGLAGVALLTGNAEFTNADGSLIGGTNMTTIHLSKLVGGDVFLGFISAVAFATILAVVSGLTLSAAATLSHDLYANVLRHGRTTERGELRVSRISTVVIGLVSILLALAFEGENVAVLATVALSIAASVNFPVLFLSMYWRGFTTRGAVAGGYAGLIAVFTLVILSPTVWVNALGFDEAIFPFTYPTLVSMAVNFLFAWWFSVTDRSERARVEARAFVPQLVHSELGALTSSR